MGEPLECLQEENIAGQSRALDAFNLLTMRSSASGKIVQSYIPSPPDPFSNFRVCFQRDTATVPLENPPEVWVCFLQVDEGKPSVKIFSIGIGEVGEEGAPIWTLDGRFGTFDWQSREVRADD